MPDRSWRIRPLAGSILMALLAACGGRMRPTETAPPITEVVRSQSTPLSVDTAFENANLTDWRVRGDTVEARIRRDTHSDAYRWYSFRLRGGEGRPIRIRLLNAGGASAAPAWSYNQPVVSADSGATWRRIRVAQYDDSIFSFTMVPGSDDEWIAYSPTYDFTRWLELVEEVRAHPRVAEVRQVGRTLEGRPLHMLILRAPGTEPDTAVWAIARQHPSETAGSFMAEGFLRWLLSDAPAAASLLERTEVRLLGFMNPDGVVHGNYRGNLAVEDLNRVWAGPDPTTAPTVAAVQEEMGRYTAAGGHVRLFVDFHAHSTFRKNFFYTNDATTTTPAAAAQAWAVAGALAALNEDFTLEGSEATATGEGVTSKGWAWLAHGTHGITFESAYQDTEYGPNAGVAMTPERWMALGADFGRALAAALFRIP